MRYLLDTNVVCELGRREPNPRVWGWHLANPGAGVPAPVVAEIADGVFRAGNPAEGVEAIRLLMEEYSGLLVPFDHEAAVAWGELRHSPETKRQPQPLWDSLIESIALARSLTVVTRNTKDFRRVATINPWGE